jgi:hypothetical protein
MQDIDEVEEKFNLCHTVENVRAESKTAEWSIDFEDEAFPIRKGRSEIFALFNPDWGTVSGRVSSFGSMRIIPKRTPNVCAIIEFHK